MRIRCRGISLISSASCSRLSSDPNEKFIGTTVINYLLRHINKYRSIDENTMEVIGWVMGNDIRKIGKHLAKIMEKDSSQLNKKKIRQTITSMLDDFSRLEDDYKEYAKMVLRHASDLPGKTQAMIQKDIVQRLEKQRAYGRSKRLCDLEKGLKSLKKMFTLSDDEVQYCLMAFIIWEYDVINNWLVEYLEVGSYVGRKYMTNLLGITIKDLQKIESGTLKHIGVVDNNENVLQEWLLNPSEKAFTRKHFRKMPKTSLTLDQHFFDFEEIQHLKNLLRKKPATSTHILFYGPPGTGKSTLAYRLIQDMGVNGYEIRRGDEHNSSTSRRASILSCIALTNSKEGAVILVDEAENVLETENAWSLKGEVRDKGWLNDLLEQPGLRIIWVVNSKSSMNDSVATRFSYSLRFKPFNLTQRTLLLEKIIAQNRIKRFFKPSDIQALAEQYTVSARDFDLTVKAAREAYHTRKDILQGIHIGLKAKHQLYGLHEKKPDTGRKNTRYSLEGLNTSQDPGQVIQRLEKFISLNRDHTIPGLNMMFHGPPGTGKTAFAKHLATHLDKKLMIRRGSDLLHCYVGSTEKNIRETFDQAQTSAAILLIDEIDFILGHRDRGRQHHDISFTNEFLTSMEDFQGILVATTNGFDRVDPAGISRFRERIEFKYLTPRGNLIFYDTYLSPLLAQPLSDRQKTAIKSIQCLTPRDFSNIRNHFILYEKDAFDHTRMINALKQDVADKEKNNNKRVVGFRMV